MSLITPAKIQAAAHRRFIRERNRLMEQWRKAKKYCKRSQQIEAAYLQLKRDGPTFTLKEAKAIDAYRRLAKILQAGRNSGKSFRTMASELKKQGVKTCKSRLHQIWQEI